MKPRESIHEIERRVRASKIYHDWVRMNRALWCLDCGCSECLEVHHITSLHAVILGLWELYGDIDTVVELTLERHRRNLEDSVTLCPECHAKRHPAKKLIRKPVELKKEEWTVVPRNHGWIFNLAKEPQLSRMGLLDTQVVFGLGWYIIGGWLDSNMLEFDRNDLARVLGKRPGSVFHKALETALVKLEQLNIIAGNHRKRNQMEIHMSPNYLERLCENPWFIPMRDIRLKDMTALSLTWFLSYQSNKRRYRIGFEKLLPHIQLFAPRPAKARERLLKACQKISWADMKFAGEFVDFRIIQGKATPIRSLRQQLDDAVGPI